MFYSYIADIPSDSGLAGTIAGDFKIIGFRDSDASTQTGILFNNYTANDAKTSFVFGGSSDSANNTSNTPITTTLGGDTISY